MRFHLARNELWRRRLRKNLNFANVKCLQVNSASKKIQRWWRDNHRSVKEKAAGLIIERFFINVKEEVDREIKRRERAKKARRQKRQRKRKEDDDSLLERVFDKVNEEEEEAKVILQSKEEAKAIAAEEAKAIKQAEEAAALELRKHQQLRESPSVISNQGHSPYRSPAHSKYVLSQNPTHIEPSPHKSRQSSRRYGDRHNQKPDRHSDKYQIEDGGSAIFTQQHEREYLGIPARSNVPVVERGSPRWSRKYDSNVHVFTTSEKKSMARLERQYIKPVHPIEDPPADTVDTSEDVKSVISGVTAPSIFLRNALVTAPSPYTSTGRKQSSEDFSLEEAWADVDIHQIKENNYSSQKYGKRPDMVKGRQKEIPFHHEEKRQRQRHKKRDKMNLSVAEENSLDHDRGDQSVISSVMDHTHGGRLMKSSKMDSSRAEYRRAGQSQGEHHRAVSRDRSSRVGGTRHFIGKDISDRSQSPLDERSVDESSNDIDEVVKLEQRFTRPHRPKKNDADERWKERGEGYQHHSVVRDQPHQYHDIDATKGERRSVRQPHSSSGRQKHRSSPKREVKISMDDVEDAIEVDMDIIQRHSPKSSRRTDSRQRASNVFDQQIEGSILMRSQSRGKTSYSNVHQSTDHVEYGMEKRRKPRMESSSFQGREHSDQRHFQNERKGHSHNQYNSDMYQSEDQNSQMESPIDRKSRRRQMLSHEEVSNLRQHRRSHSNTAKLASNKVGIERMSRRSKNRNNEMKEHRSSHEGEYLTHAIDDIGSQADVGISSRGRTPMHPQSRTRHPSQSYSGNLQAKSPAFPVGSSRYRSHSMDLQAESSMQPGRGSRYRSNSVDSERKRRHDATPPRR